MQKRFSPNRKESRRVSEQPCSETRFRSSRAPKRVFGAPSAPRWNSAGIPIISVRGPRDPGPKIGLLRRLTSDAVTRPSAAISSRSNALFSNTRFFISPLAVCRDRQGVTSRPLRPLPDWPSFFLLQPLPTYRRPALSLTFFFFLTRSLFLSIDTAGHLSDGTWWNGRRKNNSSKDT